MNIVNIVKKTLPCILAAAVEISFFALPASAEENSSDETTDTEISTENSEVTSETQEEETIQLTEEEKLLEQINTYRVVNNCVELTPSVSLDQLSAVRCSELQTLLSHYRPDQELFSTIFNEYSIDVSNAGELIASGNSEVDSAEKVSAKWFESEEDNKTILDAKYKYIGIRKTESTTGMYKYNWVILLTGDSKMLSADAAEQTLGDVNGDGSINSSDATIILTNYAKNIIKTSAKFTNSYLNRADTDKNGKADSQDATKILVYYAKTIIGEKAEL